MKKLYTCLLALSVLVFAAEDLFAQRTIGQYRGNIRAFNKNRRYWSFGGGISALNYFGDLAPKNRIASTKISFTRPGIHLQAQYRLDPRFSFRANFLYGRLKGDDDSSELDDRDGRFRHVRNVHFRNDIKQLSAVMVWDLKAHSRTFITRPELIPYVFAGVSVLHHNPKARVPDFDALHYERGDPAGVLVDNDPRYADGDGDPVSPGDWVALKPLKTEGVDYSNFAFAIPFGVGARYKVNRYWDLSFEITYNQTFTDYLDDVSGDYLSPDAFGTGPEANLARILAYRSNELDPAFIEQSTNIRFVTDPAFENNTLAPGTPFRHFAGFGNKELGAIRGKDDKDVFLVTNITLTYIMGTNLRNAKFR